MAAGAYICGEETSLLESLEGKRGQVRFKPPLPAIEGLFGKPTVINNVVTLASVPIILDQGAAYYRDYGMGRSRGTLADPAGRQPQAHRPGREGLRRDAARTARGLRRRHRQRPADDARCRSAARWAPTSRPRSSTRRSTTRRSPRSAACSAMAASWSFDDSVDMAAQARYAMEFCAIESCGKCTPCRIGSTRGVEVIDRMLRGRRRRARTQRSAAARPVPDHARRLAVRAGRHGAVPGAQRARSFPRRFCSRDRRHRGLRR